MMTTMEVAVAEDLVHAPGVGPIEVPALEAPVTVIAAMYETPDALLIGADSAVTGEAGELRQLIAKLQRHRTAPLAWAYSGYWQTGDDFSRWLADIPWPPASVDTFINETRGHLADLNRERRQFMRRAGVRPKDTDCTGVLIAAFLNEPLILSLGTTGGATRHGEGELAADGSGEPHAHIAFQALSAINVRPPRLVFEVLIKVAARHARGCSLPAHIWRVTREGIETPDE
jgi:hypothetical protein